MKLNLAALVVNVDGKPFQQPSRDGTKVEDWNPTLGDVLFAALKTPIQKDMQLQFADRKKIYGLAKKLHEGETEFSTEDVAFMKERVNSVYIDSMLIGAVDELIERKPKPVVTEAAPPAEGAVEVVGP